MKIKANNDPIGIFDSGLGGLTVAKTITEYLPNEHLIYFGDTAHTPWGDKSQAAIQAYSIKICDLLLQHHCKCIVIACHTASSAAFELVQEYVGGKAQVFNVIDPVVEHIRQNHANKKIGLIATKQTVFSDTYSRRIASLDLNIELSSLATPLLVPLIEEGFLGSDISEKVVNDYLSNPKLNNIHALILGCTHYPLVKPQIEKFYQKNIDIIDASEMTAKMLHTALARFDLLNPKNNSEKRFFVSDYNEFFENTTKVFFPGNIELKHYPLWK